MIQVPSDGGAAIPADHWTVPCDADSGVASLVGFVNDENRIVLRSPSGEFAVMGWQVAETLRAYLASATSTVLRREP